MSRRRIGLLFTVGVLAIPSAAGAHLALPVLGHHGRWLTDPQGRVVIMHGLQVDRFEPGAPVNYVDLSAAGVRFLAAEGFDLARVSMSYAGVEPSLGHFDRRYVSSYLALDRQLAAAGVWDLLDLQQGQYAAGLAGNGFPDWMSETDGQPNPRQPFPLGYFGNPAENRAWDNFWRNAPASDGIGLQDKYAAGLRRLAAAFSRAPGLLGIDVLNEPWPGSAWPTCASPVGCAAGAFDATSLTAFYRREIGALRVVDRRHLIVYEPNLLFNSGAPTQVGRLDDPKLVFAFHNYCLGDEPGLPPLDPLGVCGLEEQVVLGNSAVRAQSSGDALLMDEWGNSADPNLLRRITAEADQSMVGWSYWAYEDCCGSTGAVLAAGNQPPLSRGNLRVPVLDAIARPYPKLIAGTPTAWRYDPGSGLFTFTYSTRPIAGGRFARGVDTEVELPPLRYPTGYDVRVDGARVVSSPDANLLRLASTRGSLVVHVSVAPARSHRSEPWHPHVSSPTGR
jgi:endoglycosylceramidase